MNEHFTIVTEEYLSSTIIKTILNQLDITVISIQKKKYYTLLLFYPNRTT